MMCQFSTEYEGQFTPEVGDSGDFPAPNYRLIQYMLQMVCVLILYSIKKHTDANEIGWLMYKGELNPQMDFLTVNLSAKGRFAKYEIPKRTTKLLQQ